MNQPVQKSDREEERTIPTANWTEVACDGESIRGISSLRGPFEIPVGDVMAVGEHVRYDDDPDPMFPDEDCWLAFLTSNEYGFVYMRAWEYNRGLLKSIVTALGEEGLQIGYFGWPGWNRERGYDSRFVYPPWVFGFSVYDWPVEEGSRWRSIASRLTRTYLYPNSEGTLGRTLHWLVASDPVQERERWHSFLDSAELPHNLGARRSSHHWQSPHWMWWLLGVVSIGAVMVGAAFIEDLAKSAAGLAAALGIGLLALAPWWPELLSGVSLHDHGLSIRTWAIRRKCYFYDDIEAVEGEPDRFELRIRGRSAVRLLAGFGVYRREIEDMRRSSSMRYAKHAGIPYRLPHTL